MLRLKRDDVDARNGLTALFVKQRKYDDLFALMKEGVEIFPQDPNSHYRLGIMYDFRKEYEDAIAQYRQAISLKSDHAKALNALGKVYLKTGEKEKAREALEAAKEADPNLSEASAMLSNLKDEQVAGQVNGSKRKHLVAKSKKKAKNKKSVVMKNKRRSSRQKRL